VKEANTHCIQRFQNEAGPLKGRRGGANCRAGPQYNKVVGFSGQKGKMMGLVNGYAVSQIDGGGVTSPQGFRAGGKHIGIKKSGNADIALLTSDVPCSSAGVFTTNAIRASCVEWCKKLLPSSSIRAIVCTSGCANACTGEQGELDTSQVASIVANTIGLPADSVLVAATGVIGCFLPMDLLQDAIPPFTETLAPDGGSAFSEAIMTTDTRPKECAYKIDCSIGSVIVGGCAKGSGMIHPMMATMLGFITSDVRIEPSLLQVILRRVTDRTFNNLTIDGDTSTNDMVVMASNGLAGPLLSAEEDIIAFEQALLNVCDELCKQIAADGEGATKRIEVVVEGAVSVGDAKKAAKAIANSNLVKTALFGNDPNWGRIACAIGYSGAVFSKEKMGIALCGVPVFKNVQPVTFDEKRVHELLTASVVTIHVTLGMGAHSAMAHTCDLTYDYVKINAEYHT